MKLHRASILFRSLLCGLLLPPGSILAGQYTNFDVSIYIPVSVVRNFENAEKLLNDWERISAQLGA